MKGRLQEVRRLVSLGEPSETFEAAVASAFKPVHAALGEALARLAEHGVTGRTAVLERIY